MAKKTKKREAGPYFGFRPGRMLDRRYVIREFIGYGYEGEVYRICETATGIERVAKFFYPYRYPDRRRSVRLAQKFHKLRECSVVLQYHHSGEMTWKRQRVVYLVSELAPGVPLSELLARQPGKRFHPFEALHIAYAIAKGVAEIHALREYHGDIHIDNVLVDRRGVGFRIKLIDLYLLPKGWSERRKADVADIAAVLYSLVGGPAGYSKAPQIVREIVCGRRRQILYRKFPSATALVEFMETYPWPEER